MDAEEILKIIKGIGGYIGGVYYPPVEEPITDEDIQRTLEDFTAWSRNKNPDDF